MPFYLNIPQHISDSTLLQRLDQEAQSNSLDVDFKIQFHLIVTDEQKDSTDNSQNRMVIPSSAPFNEMMKLQDELNCESQKANRSHQ